MFRLYVIADYETAGSADAYATFLGRVAPALQGQWFAADDSSSTVGMLQVRLKGLTRERHRAALAVAKEALGTRTMLTMLNGALTPRGASRAGFLGVHWPESSIPAKPGAGSGGFAGASVHNAFAVRRAEEAGTRFAVFGPVFDAGSKPVPGVGLDRLREITRMARIPIFAVGGITPDRVADCIAAGAHGVAVVTGIMRAPDPVVAIDKYLAAIDEALTRTAAPLSTKH